jgi:K+-transporting ATPase KdpF subunit
MRSGVEIEAMAGLLVSVVTLGYLIVALVKPEKF